MEADERRMVTLKTLCMLYDWKYETIWRKYKAGVFVQGYRDPSGRGIRFNLKDVDAWAHQEPVKVDLPSLLRNVI